MSRYFFHVRNGIPLVIDKVGKELAGLFEARLEARALADQVRSELGKVPQLSRELHVEIEDDTGKVLGIVNLYQ